MTLAAATIAKAKTGTATATAAAEEDEIEEATTAGGDLAIAAATTTGATRAAATAAEINEVTAVELAVAPTKNRSTNTNRKTHCTAYLPDVELHPVSDDGRHSRAPPEGGQGKDGPVLDRPAAAAAPPPS